MSKAVLITGATGFMGMRLRNKLSENGYVVYGFASNELDVRFKESFDALADIEISHIFHLAAKTSIPESWASPEEYYLTNTMGTLHLLEYAKSKKASVTLVSTYVYGKPQYLPVDENHPVNPSSPYGHSKYLAESICEFYVKNFNMKINIIRPFNIYGAGQKSSFLIPKIICQSLCDSEIIVDDLKPRRDFVHVDDVCDAMIKMMDLEEFCILNVGSGISYSVEDIISIVQDLEGINKKVISLNQKRRNEINDLYADIEQAKKLLDWEPKIKMEIGLELVLKECKRKRDLD